MHIPSLVLAVVSDASSALSIGLEEELLRGISDVAIASGKFSEPLARRESTCARCLHHHGLLSRECRFTAYR
jgi:hypothetical protein